MNYEEKYNEILEWARKNKARLNGVSIEEVLPELRESEDERIRKAIIEHFKQSEQIYPGLTFGGYYYADVRAWLEKQKEQEPEWSEEDKLMMKAVIGILDENDHPKLCSWLKSLRPSWKPSEEQMNALLNIEGDLRAFQYNDKAKIIAELYEQLKRL